MISVLMPSRSRVELARKAIESLGKGDFEVLICIDYDDPQIEEYKKLCSPFVRLFMEPRHGYENLHKYYNRLSKEAKGDWLLLFNDDATMETENWTKMVDGFNPKEPVVLNIFHEIDNLFPLISRKFYEILGHYSLNTHADSWVQQVGERSGTQHYVEGYKIIHLKPTDETGQASTHTAVSNTGPQFSSPQMQQLINQDAETIKQYIRSNQ